MVDIEADGVLEKADSPSLAAVALSRGGRGFEISVQMVTSWR